MASALVLEVSTEISLSFLKGDIGCKIHFYMVFAYKCVLVCGHNHPTMIKIHLLFFYFIFFITDENRKEGGGDCGHAPHRIYFKDICITYSFIVTVMYFFLPYVQNCHFSLSHKIFLNILLQHFTKIKIEDIWSKSNVIKDELLYRLFMTILAD